MTYQIRKETAGHYRVSGERHYAPIHKRADGWHAEIHTQADGALVRYAGIWSTLKAAVEEAKDTMDRM